MNFEARRKCMPFSKSTVYFSFRSLLVFFNSITSSEFLFPKFRLRRYDVVVNVAQNFSFDLMFSFPLVISLTKRYMKLM